MYFSCCSLCKKKICFTNPLFEKVTEVSARTVLPTKCWWPLFILEVGGGTGPFFSAGRMEAGWDYWVLG